MRTLEKITVKNFKSIREQTLALGRLNVFIGGNGAGKSNLIQVFRFLREIMTLNLGTYVALKGGADTLLHFGRKRSPKMSFSLVFTGDDQSVSYKITLIGTDDDKLFISPEFSREGPEMGNSLVHVAASEPQTESTFARSREPSIRPILNDLDSFWIYHFHDTSDTAAMKATCDVDDNRFLKAQAENLPAFLYWLQKKKPDHFALIEDTIRQIAPFFGGFRLEPSRLNEAKIRLEWAERGSDGYFNATALSDGTLRFICLATLLLQPDLPSVLLLDEPELGLHPAAVVLLAGMLESAATKTQVIVATQSVTLVNQLTPEQVWAVEREGGESVFRPLSQADTAGWLDDYSLGELWEKNILGARP